MDTYVINDNKRREVARFIRQMADKNFDFEKENIAAAIDTSAYNSGYHCFNRLADLIDPDPLTIDDVYWWAFVSMEGCDEPERTLFNEIEMAIDKYKDETKEKKDNGKLD